tara:strand:- start:160 stop:636 length:477 start_codon:yes stop_codon:yes gene_type:complete
MKPILPLNKSNILIKRISAEDTHAIRQAILRPGKPIESCKFSGDDDSETFHLGLYYQKKIVAVASYMLNSNHRFSVKKQYQLRGMAVLEDFKGHQLGNYLLEKGEAICLEKQVNFIWFNAREIAVNFYKRNKYKVLGGYFNIEDVGIHILMFKDLNEN